MDCKKAWETFARSGLVCDYLQYAASSRSVPDTDAKNGIAEGRIPLCNVSRTE